VKKSVLKVVVVLSFGIMPFLGYAEVPGTMSYQGYLSDAQNRPFDGTTDITFSIPSTTWTEIHQGVPVQQGVFGVLLGSKKSLTGVDFSQARSLRIDVNSVSQTVPLSSVPYALRADTVENESDPTVVPSVKDGVSWDEISGKPTKLTGDNYHSVHLKELQGHQPLCTANNIWTELPCQNACHRWCRSAKGYSGGTLAEWNGYTSTVGCICIP